MHDINSKEYWNMRFRDDWQAALGRQQTAFFAQVALASCPAWFIDDLRAQRLSICDWGCALGDAVPPLARKFPDNTITGWDFSEIAIQEARKLAPQFTFHNGEIRHSNAKFDVIFASNIFEHFHDPFSVMTEVSTSAREYLWIVVPFCDNPGIDEHFFRFEYENMRAWVAPDFSLVYFNDIDVSSWPHSQWHGRQATLIYARAHVLPRIAPHGYEMSPSGQCEAFVSPSLEISVRRLAERDLQLRGITERMTAIATRATEVEQTFRAQLTAAQSEAAGREQQLSRQISTLEEKLNNTRANVAEIEPLRIALSERGAEIANAAERELQLRAQIVALNEELNNIQTRVAEIEPLRIALSERGAEIANAAEREQQLRAQIVALNEGLNNNQTKVAEIEPLRIALAERDQQVAGAARRQKVLEAELFLLRRELENLQSLRRELDNRYQEIIACNQAENRDLNHRYLEMTARLQAENAKLDHRYEEMTARLHAEIDDLQHNQVIERKTNALLGREVSFSRRFLTVSTAVDKRPGVGTRLRLALLLRAARQAARKLEWATAECNYVALLNGHVAAPELWVQYGHSLKEQGDISAAFGAYQRALQIDPNLADAHLQLGHALKMLGLQDEAKAAYVQAYRLRPVLTPARSELSALGVTPGELTTLVLSNESRSSGRPHGDKYGLRVRFTLQSARRAARQKNWELAETRYRRVLRLNPSEPRFWVQLGHALKEQGAFTEAEGAYLQAITLDPASPDIHLQLGHVLKLQRRLIDAIEFYKVAYRLQPGMTDPRQELLRLGLTEEEIAAVGQVGETTGTETQRSPLPDTPVPPPPPRAQVNDLRELQPHPTQTIRRDRFSGRRIPESEQARADKAPIATTINTPFAPDLKTAKETTIGVLMLVADFDKGGLEQVVFDLSINLRARGLWVGILIFGRSGEMGSKAAGAGIPVFAGPEPIAHLKQILDAFSSLVILNHHCYSGWELAAQGGAKIVEVIHNTYHWQLGDHSKRAIRSLADQFVAVSRSARDYAITYLGIDAGKTIVVNNGLLPNGFTQPSVSEMDQLRSGSEFRILQVANIYGHKCHNTMLTAFERFYRDHPQARLTFAGDIVEPEVYQQLVHRIEAYGLKDVVTFTGHVDRIALGRLYASAHVSVLPSIVEGFSIASLESAYFGVPLIATDTGAARDLITDDDIGIVIGGPVADPSQLSTPLVVDLGRREDAGHANEISDALERMIGNRVAWKEMSRKALHKAKSFSVDFATDRYEHLIRRLAGRSERTLSLVGASRGERGLVSIVMPVYNHASLVPQAIQAVIDQTYANWELIVVNDGSSDDFVTAIRPYLIEPRIRFLTQPNQKLPAALNNGFRHARGEYLTWTSADNIMLPKQLERLVQTLEEDHGAGLAYSNYYAIDDRGAPLTDPTWRAKDRQDGTSLVRLPSTVTIENFHPASDDYGNNFIGPSFLYRAEVGSAIGTYDVRTFGGEDYDFWLRMHLITRFHHVEEPLYLYRVHDNTISGRFNNLGLPENLRYALGADIQRRNTLLSNSALAVTEKHSAWRNLGQYDPARCIYRSVKYSDAGSCSSIDGILVCEIDVPLRSVELNRLQQIDIIVAASEIVYFWLKQCPEMAHKRLFCGSVEGLTDVLGHAAAQCSFERSRQLRTMVARGTPAETLRAALPHHILLLLDEIDDLRGVTVAELARDLRGRGIRVTVAAIAEPAEFRDRSAFGAVEASSHAMGLDYDLEALEHYIRSERVGVVSRHDTLLGAGFIEDIGVSQCFVIHDTAFWSSADGLGQWRDVAPTIETYIVPSREMAEVAEGVLGSRIGRLMVLPENNEPNSREQSSPSRQQLVEAHLQQYALARLVSGNRRVFGNDAAGTIFSP